MDEQVIYMSESIGKIASALSAFQGSVTQPKLSKTVAVRTKTGGSYTFKYADLAECMGAAKKALSENGLAVTQIVMSGKLLTVLMHSSGEWLRSTIELPKAADVQGYGSLLTYMKRYSYCAILGIVADDDDDANSHMGNEYQMRGAQPQQYQQTQQFQQPAAMAAARMGEAIARVQAAQDKDELLAVYNEYKDLQNALAFKNACTSRRKEMEAQGR